MMTFYGVMARGCLYVGIAVLTELLPILSSDEQVKWPVVICKMVLVAAVTLRSFIDQSVTQHQDSVEVNNPDA